VTQRLEVTQADAEGGPKLRHRREEPIVRRSPPQHRPQPLNVIERRTLTGQAIQRQMRRGREHLRDPSAPMPGRVIDRNEDGLSQRGRLRPDQVP
jgi:hypothetical protein